MSRLLKRIDAILGRLAVAFFSVAKAGAFPYQLRDVLFIRPGGIGDAVLLLPVMQKLKEKHPAVRLYVLAEKRNGAVFSLYPDIFHIYYYDKPSDLLSAIRGRYDAVIDTEQWHRLSAVVARMTCTPALIGYASNERTRLFTHPISYFHDDYETQSFFHLIAPLVRDVPFDVSPPFLAVPEAAQKRAGDILHSLRGRKIVGIFPGGTIRERRWGSDRFQAVAKRLVERGYGVAITGGREDVASGRKIAAGLENTVDVCGRLSLIETAGVLERAALLITGDSGIMHIAYGLGTSTLSLFGPGIEKKWAPRGPGHVAINKNLDCSPCTKFGYTPKCKKNAECMQRISVDEVIAKALELLEG